MCFVWLFKGSSWHSLYPNFSPNIGVWKASFNYHSGTFKEFAWRESLGKLNLRTLHSFWFPTISASAQFRPWVVQSSFQCLHGFPHHTITCETEIETESSRGACDGPRWKVIAYIDSSWLQSLRALKIAGLSTGREVEVALSMKDFCCCWIRGIPTLPWGPRAYQVGAVHSLAVQPLPVATKFKTINSTLHQYVLGQPGTP